ncbi:hypothetical protein ACFE04_006472 [Oxalis oulophora]
MFKFSNKLQSPLNKPWSIHSSSSLIKFIHTTTNPESNNNNTTQIVNSITNSLKNNSNWDTLTSKFNSTQLNTTIIKQVLLSLKQPNYAKQALRFFHWSANCKGFQHGACTYALTIHILIRASLLTDAKALLESVLKKTHVNNSPKFLVVDCLIDSFKVTDSNPLVFNLLVQYYAKLRFFNVGFDVCCYLEDHHGFCLSLITYNSLIHVVQKSDLYDLVWKIYERLIIRRVYPNEVTIRTMIGALCKGGKLREVMDLIDVIHGKRCSASVIVNTNLVLRIVEEGRVEEGMALLKRMLQKNMILDTIAYSLIVYSKVKLNDLDSAWTVYEEMLKRGFNANSFVHTSFIGAFCGKGKIDEAIRLMQEMEDMNLKAYDETFDFLIIGCANAGRVEESLNYCRKMMTCQIIPSCLAFNEMVGKLTEFDNLKLADAMLTDLLNMGFVPEETTYSRLIAGYSNAGKCEEAIKLYHEMEYRSLNPGSLVFSSLIKGLCQCGKLAEAQKYLKIMKDRALEPYEDVHEAFVTTG